MYAYNCQVNDLYDSARNSEVMVSCNDDPERKRIRFTLTVNEERKWQKISRNPLGNDRKAGKAVCFHGHYKFLAELFRINPAAVVTSSRFGNVRYTADNFENEAEEYGNTPLGPSGNIYHEILMRDCCDCEEI